MSTDRDFLAARQAGARGIGGVIVLLVFLAVLGFLAQPSLSFDGSGPAPVFLGVLVFLAAGALVMLVIDVRRRVRRGSAWRRAERGAVTLTLRGQTVGTERKVSGRHMRTVVVEHSGERRYLHLLFAKGGSAGAIRKGPVTVEFFAGDDVEGPARVLLPDGRSVWAFTSRLGGRPPVDDRRGATSSSSDAGAGSMMVPAVFASGYGLGGDDPDRNREDVGPDDGSGGETGESVWSGGDGWTGGDSWGGDSTWSGSDGGSGGGGGWSGGDFGGGGWSGGDSGGGGDAGGGGGGS